MQQWDAHQGTDVHAWAGDLNQAGVDEHLDPGAFESPGERAKVMISSGAVGGDSDGVAVDPAYDCCDVLEVAEDRHIQVGTSIAKPCGRQAPITFMPQYGSRSRRHLSR